VTELEIIKHNDILFRDLLRAIAVKNVSWPHPVESQVKWVIDNMQPEDLHVFLKEEGEDLAYMTLSPVIATVNGVNTSFMGLGCVCSAKHGVGLGKKLMENVNKWLKDNNHKGLLFCKIELVQFYKKYGWSLIEPASVIFTTPLDGVYTMSYNCEGIKKIEYKDRFF
jgi:predicted N-acetyltransferase YhbS